MVNDKNRLDTDIVEVEVEEVDETPEVLSADGIVFGEPAADIVNENAQTHQSEESQQEPPSFDHEPTPELPHDIVFGNVKRTFSDNGYVTEEYVQTVEPEENDLQAVIDPEENDLEK